MDDTAPQGYLAETEERGENGTATDRQAAIVGQDSPAPEGADLYPSIGESMRRQARFIVALAVLLALAGTPAVAMAGHRRPPGKLTKTQLKHWRVIRSEARKPKYHLSKTQRKAVKKIGYWESGFRPNAQNGICKGAFQLRCGWSNGKLLRPWLYRNRRWAKLRPNFKEADRYVKSRYGSWPKAVEHHYRYNWY